MILVIDNYDSFTWNLVQYLQELGTAVEVVRNDQTSAGQALSSGAEAFLLSPGPCTPNEAGISLDLVAACADAGRPLLGVCLGHQAIGQHFGGRVVRAAELMHGKTSPIHHDGTGLFAGLPSPFTATRYHSLVVAPEGLPGGLVVNARTEDGVIMGFRHATLPIHGVQFHPESIATEHGHAMLANFLALAGAGRGMTDIALLPDPAGPLEFATARAAFDDLLDGRVPDAAAAAFLAAMAERDETSVEIAAAAQALRERMVEVRAPAGAIDVCGTGGDGAHSLNISTAVAIVVAACGVPVAKHGNRAASSRAGAADTLEALGLDLARAAATAEDSLAGIGLCFLFAQAHHPALGRLAAVRRQIGRRTIFNLVGPLANPARVTRQLVGIARVDFLDTVAAALELLGTEGAMLVSGEESLDELSIAGPSRVVRLGACTGGEACVTPEDAGLARHGLDAIRGGDAAYNAAALAAMLDGAASPYRDAVLLNAAAALQVAGRAAGWEDGAVLAAEAIDDGAAKELLRRWISF